jgi:hypothetical protein
MPQFDPYTSSSIPSDHKNKVENATSKPVAPVTLQKPAEPERSLAECDICECCRANTSSHAQRPPTCASPTSTCCGTSCPDLNTANADANSQFHSPATFHQRHAHLRLQQQQQTLLPSTGESFSGTRLSPEEQARDLPELQSSQQEDDSIRMILAGERAESEGVDGDEPVPGEFKKEIEMLNGGWMDRSKMC